jgi:hypothetical protein
VRNTSVWGKNVGNGDLFRRQPAFFLRFFIEFNDLYYELLPILMMLTRFEIFCNGSTLAIHNFVLKF